MPTTDRTFFVRINLDAADDLDAVSDSIFEELSAIGFDVIAVDVRDDVDQTPTGSEGVIDSNILP